MSPVPKAAITFRLEISEIYSCDISPTAEPTLVIQSLLFPNFGVELIIINVQNKFKANVKKSF